MTYTIVDKYFLPSGVMQVPDRIIVHRQGHPGAHAANAIEWMAREGLSVHEYIEDDTVYHTQHWDQHAIHCSEFRKAFQMGYEVMTPNGQVRGDWKAIGIETCDIAGGASGQVYSLSQQTRISLVRRLTDICRITGISSDAIHEHAELDPWQRAEDLGDALNIPDLRADVRDMYDGKQPWRTVQQYATGAPAPDSWRDNAPVVAPPVAVDPRAALQDALRDAEDALTRMRLLIADL